ncbi:MAG: bifunctional adenosylcobinamide kinase/adenosylcobinamide-phosphate guanylyltransferase [Acetivibrio sp.]
MKVWISGGCKNGKSTYAQKIAQHQKKENQPLYYVATMCPVDEEDEERIHRHVLERRGMGFKTIETPTHIGEILTSCNKSGSFLIDSVTALLANEMFSEEGIHWEIEKKIGAELEEILEQVKDIVIVSDYIYADCGIFSEDTENYRRSLAYLDRICVKNCDIVLEISFGNAIIHKGRKLYETLV